MTKEETHESPFQSLRFFVGVEWSNAAVRTAHSVVALCIAWRFIFRSWVRISHRCGAVLCGRRDIILGRTPIDENSALSARSVVNDPRDGSVHRVGTDAAVVVVWMAPSSECASHRNMHRPIASERRSSPSR